jgi:hypothetical protein
MQTNIPTENPEQFRQKMSIVCLGNFNPRIFQPEWFGRHSLLLEPEIDQQKNSTSFVSTDYSYFVAGDWLTFKCSFQKMIVETTDPSKFYPLGDLVASIFAVLDQTPIDSYGFNADAGYDFTSRDVFDRLGHTLAPKEAVWNQLMTKPGLSSIAMMDGPFDDQAFRRLLKIDHLMDRPMGIEVSENRHFDEVNAKKYFKLSDTMLSIVPAINEFYGDFVDGWEDNFRKMINLAISG